MVFVREGYVCPDCQRPLHTWKGKTIDGNTIKKYKCYKCEKLSDTRLLQKTKIYSLSPSKRSNKRQDSVSASLTRETLLNTIYNIDDLQTQAFFSALYLTAGRVSEICNYRDKKGKKHSGLHKYQFSTQNIDGQKWMWIQGMRVLKVRKEKYMMKGIPISFTIDHDFLEPLVMYLGQIEREDVLFNWSRQYSYELVRRYTGAYPHRFRDLRVYDLMMTYGWDGDMIVKFIGWQNYDMIKRYLKLKPMDLVRKTVFKPL